MTEMISSDHIQLPIDGMGYFLSHKDHATKQFQSLMDERDHFFITHGWQR
jgi:hypothetical protein